MQLCAPRNGLSRRASALWSLREDNMMSDLNASVPDLATEDLVGTTVVRAALNRRSQLFFWIWIAAIAVVGFALRTLIPMNIG